MRFGRTALISCDAEFWWCLAKNSVTVESMSELHSEDDQRMIRLQEGDSTAFDDIVATWQTPLYRFFMRNTRDAQRSEDLVQETLLRLYKSSWDFIPSGCFRGWLFRVARNLLIDTFRRDSSDALLRRITIVSGRDGEVTDVLNLLPDVLKGAEEQASEREIAGIVQELLESLPEEQRITFEMHHFDSLTLAEVADAMQTTLPTAKSRLRLAREKLSYALTCRGFSSETVSEMN